MPVSYFLPIELWNYRPEVSRGHFACQHEELPRRTASIDLIASFLAVWEEREGNHLFTNCDIWASAGCHELVKAQSSQLLQRTVHWMALALWYKIQNKGALWSWHDSELILRAQTGGVVICLEHVSSMNVFASPYKLVVIPN